MIKTAYKCFDLLLKDALRKITTISFFFNRYLFFHDDVYQTFLYILCLIAYNDILQFITIIYYSQTFNVAVINLRVKCSCCLFDFDRPPIFYRVDFLTVFIMDLLKICFFLNYLDRQRLLFIIFIRKIHTYFNGHEPLLGDTKIAETFLWRTVLITCYYGQMGTVIVVCPLKRTLRVPNCAKLYRITVYWIVFIT